MALKAQYLKSLLPSFEYRLTKFMKLTLLKGWTYPVKEIKDK